MMMTECAAPEDLATRIRGKKLMARIEAMDEVQEVSLWTRVPGKERLYVGLTKFNGGREWNGGVGHCVVVHLPSGVVELDGRRRWAGARTAGHHKDHGTVAALPAVVREHLG